MSVLICTRNRPEDIELCLKSVLACDHKSFEIIVVDQSTDAKTEAVVNALPDSSERINYLRTSTVGKTRALNIGLEHATGSIIAFTDDDCEVPADWLTRIQTEFDSDPSLDVIIGPVLPAPSLVGRSDICVPCWVFSDRRDMRADEVCGMGANMALRTDIFRRIQVSCRFDPHLGPGTSLPASEEGDFIYRIRRLGARAGLRPDIQVWHSAWRSPEFWNTVIFGYAVGDAAFHLKHARCKDAWAMRTIFVTLLRSGFRSMVKGLLHRKNNDSHYLRGYMAGLARSKAFAVDVNNRLYIE